MLMFKLQNNQRANSEIQGESKLGSSVLIRNKIFFENVLYPSLSPYQNQCRSHNALPSLSQSTEDGIIQR